MEEIKVGDVVRFKGESYRNINFVVSAIDRKIGPDASVVNLLFMSEKTGAPEKIYRVPSCCLTKIPLSRIEYHLNYERTPDSIIEGDVVSLKGQGNDPKKMVVKEVSTTGSDITAIYYNPTKGDASDTGSIGRECFNIYEMVVKK